ncbi:hypothetical protein UFOVP688_25 [uncultured Caudovirales phage]|uniref:Terminase small subunit n=1 Tax=uncultured Caudovirales phage TaxID=2100421 RepID=A0A6J5NI85_9CAUD|nr:hypothetical protein UFOVP688_25 [uncultured Caudovirales phage]
MSPMGRPPKPIEQKRALGNPGKRPLPTEGSLVLLPSMYEVPEPPRPLVTEAAKALWNRTWTMGQTWLSPQTDIELLLMTCEMVDERWNLRIKVLQDNRPEERKGLRDLERQLVANLSLLGFTPTDRSRLGVAEVKKISKLEALREQQNKPRD